MSRQAAEKRGHWGEHIAAIWLILHGWRILGQRIRVRAGEVDIIARRGKKIAFVEVKTRRRASDLDLAIDAQRLRRVRAAAIALAASRSPVPVACVTWQSTIRAWRLSMSTCPR